MGKLPDILDELGIIKDYDYAVGEYQRLKSLAHEARVNILKKYFEKGVAYEDCDHPVQYTDHARQGDFCKYCGKEVD